MSRLPSSFNNPILRDIFSDLLPPSARLARQARTEQLYPPLTQEEEDEITPGLLSKSMRALEYVGETLDKPGRALRGLLAGRPEAALNLIPFSDMLGITDPQKSTTGRELVEKLGFAPNDPDKWFEPGDIAGFAAEVLLDPLTYVSGGAASLTKPAQALQKAGLLDDLAKVATKGVGKMGKREARLRTKIGDVWDFVNKISDPAKQKAAKAAADKAASAMNLPSFGTLSPAELNKPLGGLMGYGLPMMSPMGVLGTGPRSIKAAQLMDKTGEWIGSSKVGSAVRGLFDPSVKSSTYAPAQRAISNMSKIIGIREEEIASRKFATLDNIIPKDKSNVSGLAAYWEKGKHYRDSPGIEEISEKTKGIIDSTIESARKNIHEAIDLGVDVNEWKETEAFRYLPHYVLGPAGDPKISSAFESKIFGGAGKALQPRDPALDKVYQETINSWVLLHGGKVRKV